MAKATKKSKNTTPDVESSTSSAKSKKAKTYHQSKTRTGEKSCRSCSQCSENVGNTYKKAKRTLTRMRENNASEKIVPPIKKTKRAKGEALFGHYHRLMNGRTTSTDMEPDLSSTESSSASTSDEESQ